MPRTKRKLPVEEANLDGLTFDKLGRMQYHPEFHPNHGKPFTLDDLIYLCKFHGVDDMRTLSYAVGKTEHTVASKITKLRSMGLFDQYRTMPESDWEKIVKEVNNDANQSLPQSNGLADHPRLFQRICHNSLCT